MVRSALWKYAQEAHRSRFVENRKPSWKIDGSTGQCQIYSSLLANITTAFAGAYMANAQWNICYGPDWTCSNAAFAMMAHFLEDRVPLADVWPQEQFLWGGIFGSSKFATDAVRALPRASELMPRWNGEVPAECVYDETKVAVIWNFTGVSNAELDQKGNSCSPMRADYAPLT
jgi:hypothetical protein